MNSLVKNLIAAGIVQFGLVACVKTLPKFNDNSLRHYASSWEKSEPVDLIDIQSFFAGGMIKDPLISPSGTKIIYLQRETRGAGVYLLNTVTGETKRLSDGRPDMQFFWTRDEINAVVAFGGRAVTFDVESGDRVNFLSENQNLSVLQADTKMAQSVIAGRKDEAGNIIEIIRISLDGNPTSLYEGTHPIREFLIGMDGQISLVKELRDNKQEIIGIRNGSIRSLLSCAALDPCRLVDMSDDGLSFTMLGYLGSDLRGLHSLSTNDGAVLSIATDPRKIADATVVDTDMETGEPLAMGFAHEPSGKLAVEASMQPHLDRLAKKLSGSTLTIEGALRGKRWLIIESSMVKHRRAYHLYDPDSGNLEEIFSEVNASGDIIKTDFLIAKEPFSYRSIDGKTLYGYVSVPKGLNPKITPLVTLVHGGPTARARGRLDPLVQFLVNRGYTVFEPNFRGSTGYGLSYRAGSKAQFGKDSIIQSDIVDGVKALQAEGIASQAPVGIMGHSFGGFSVLSALTFSGDIFTAGYAESGPGDIGESLIANAKGSDPATGLPRYLRFLEDGIDVNDVSYFSTLKNNAPAGYPKLMTKPLLMVAGGEDDIVNSQEIVSYAQRLKSNGANVTLLLDPEVGHDLGTRQLRFSTFVLMEQFFAKHLGGKTSGNIPEEVRAHVEEILIVGSSEALGLGEEKKAGESH